MTVTTIAKLLTVGLLVALIASPTVAGAAPTGPAFPPPGGVTFASSGNAGLAGGGTWSFSAFDSAAYGQLYWGTAGDGLVKLALDGAIDSPGEIMTLAGFSSGGAVWTGSSTIWICGVSCAPSAVDTRFTLTLSGAVGALFDRSTLGLPGNDPLAEVFGDFTANRLFEAGFAGSGNWSPADQFFNQNNTTFSTVKSFTAGFYSTPAEAVPEPGVLLTLALGAAGVVGYGVRRGRRT